MIQNDQARSVEGEANLVKKGNCTASAQEENTEQKGLLKVLYLL